MSKQRTLALGMMLISGVFISAPIFAADVKHGHDWFCPEPEEHAVYEKHRAKYHDHSANEMVLLIDAVYADQAMSSDQKKERVRGLLQDYGSKIKHGIGD